LYGSMHDNAIRRIAYDYRRKGYKAIINTADRIRIPDLLLQAPDGKLLWIEIQDKMTKQQIKRFRKLREELKLVGVELKVYYLRTKRGLTKLGKSIKPSPFYFKEEMESDGL